MALSRALWATLIVGALVSDARAGKVLDWTKGIDEGLAKGVPAFVKFYAPWCGHCKSMAPLYVQAAAKIDTDDLTFAEVDATQFDEKEQVRWNVMGYPTIYLFIDGKAYDYDGDRSAVGLLKFAAGGYLKTTGAPIPKVGGRLSFAMAKYQEDHPGQDPFADIPEEGSAPEGMTDLTDNNYAGKVAEKSGGWLIKIYAPWCGHCKALAGVFEKLAKDFSTMEDMNLGRIDGTAQERLAQRFKAEAFPTIIYVLQDQVFVYEGDRSFDSLKQFAMSDHSMAENTFELPLMPPPIERKAGGDMEGVPEMDDPEAPEAPQAEQEAEMDNPLEGKIDPESLLKPGEKFVDDLDMHWDDDGGLPIESDLTGHIEPSANFDDEGATVEAVGSEGGEIPLISYIAGGTLRVAFFVPRHANLTMEKGAEEGAYVLNVITPGESPFRTYNGAGEPVTQGSVTFRIPKGPFKYETTEVLMITGQRLQATFTLFFPSSDVQEEFKLEGEGDAPVEEVDHSIEGEEEAAPDSKGRTFGQDGVKEGDIPEFNAGEAADAAEGLFTSTGEGNDGDVEWDGTDSGADPPPVEEEEQ